MAEYRIVAKVDPQTAAGTNKVKADLRGVQQEAKATETALNRSFDQQKFDRTIGGLVTRIEQMDGSIKGLSGTQDTLTKSNETLGQALDRMAASAGKASTQTTNSGKAAGDAASKNTQYEAALLRVLRAVDQDAAEQTRLNALLADAKKLLDAGVISADRYAQVQKLATEQSASLNVQTGAQRIGMQQLGYQLGDVATMYSLGAKPAQIFASQIGQVSQALMLMGSDNKGGLLGKVAGFLSGPWGIAFTVATIILSPFVAKLFEGNDALGDAVDKMKKDAAQTAIDAQAKEAFRHTIEGVTAAIREQNDELKKNQQTQRDSLIAGMATANQNLDIVKQQQAAAKQAIQDAKDAYAAQKARASGPGQGGDLAAMGLSRAYDQIGVAQQRYDDLTKTVNDAEEAIRRANAAYADQAATVANDPVARVTQQYDQQKKAAIDAYVASKDNSEAAALALTKELTLLDAKRKKAEDAARAQQNLNNADAKGVAIFQSRQQAIGIAGRELQKDGLRVGENYQFGGVTANHPGMGNSNHGKYAIDVNEGTGITEANVPDLKAKFDQMARRYQARGYRVLWNGQVYEANGNGPARAIPGGQDQHRDHMHLEAPATIVGKPTQASTEEQYQQDQRDAARASSQQQKVQERASDFVAAIQTRAASTGVPADRQSQLNAQIDEALAEFTRRFDRQANPEEAASIRKAFTDADARDTAKRFDEAYVQPLQRLKDLQGTTGVDREVLNAKLEETLRLGRELTPVEAQMIENGVRQGDQLQRQQQLLEQIKGPLETYRATIEALNKLLESGTINQTSYNARIAELAQTAASTVSSVPGVDAGTGKNYEDVSKVADENSRYAKQLEDFQNYRDELIKMGVDYDGLEEAAHQDHINRLAQIDQARKDTQLAAQEDIMGSLVSIASDSFGKQSAIYRAAFATEKAVAIARSVLAIQTGIAQASSLPFPANLVAMATVAAQTASIIANIRAVTLAFKDGGYVSGPGGSRTDSINARLSDGEFVVNAQATASHRPLLEAINSGQQVRQATAAHVAQAGASMMPAAPVMTPPAQVNQRIVNVLDPSIVGDYLATPEGETLVLNVIKRNPEAVRSAGNDR